MSERRPFDGHLVLVGLPGAGKSTCARLLAARLGREVIDLDQEIERRVGLTVPEIFERLGEPRFRELEHQATLEVVSRLPAVIAPGGGWIENPDNVAAARRVGRVIHLAVSPTRALARLGSDSGGRPLLQGPDPAAALEALFARRRPLYERADAIVDTEIFNPQQVTDSLQELALRWGTAIG